MIEIIKRLKLFVGCQQLDQVCTMGRIAKGNKAISFDLGTCA